MEQSWRLWLGGLIDKWLQPLDWSRLSEWSSSFVVRSSYFWFVFIPICVKALAKTNPLLQFNLLGQEISLVLALPFSWWLFYFSSVPFAVGRVIFMSRCPELVRRYRRYIDFEEDGKSQLILKETYVSNCKKRLSPSEYHRALGDFSKRFCNIGSSGEDNFLKETHVEEHRSADAFYFVRSLVSLNQPIWRLLCSFAYCIGISLFALTCLDAIRFVIQFLFDGQVFASDAAQNL